MSSNVDKIKERLSIEEVVGNYLKLEKSGSNLKAKCPFHSEKTASFFVSPDRGTYYCFGCSAKGDIFTFVQEFEGLDFLGALKSLALRAGVQLEFEKSSDKDDREKLFELLQIATNYFEENLKNNKEALNFLKKRGIKSATAKTWRLGFAPLEWQGLIDHCRQRGFSDSELKKTGLAKTSADKKERLYDVFRGRIMFPIFDNALRVIAFSGRILIDKDPSMKSGQANAPKYLNSPETSLFNKSEVLYGFDKARFEIRKRNYSILVEGQIDLVLSHQAGFGNAVSSSGTALTLKQLEKLNRLSPRIVLAYDGDSAGFRALEKGAKLALSLGMNVGIAPLPKGEDPASIISKDPKNWEEILKKSCHIIDFFLEKILSSGMEDRQVDREIKNKILPFVAILPSNIEQSRFISKIADKANIKESAVWEDLKNLPQNDELEKEFNEDIKQPKKGRKESIIEQLAGILFWQENIGSQSLVNVIDLKRQLLEMAEESFLETLKGKKDELIFEAEAYFGENEKLGQILEDLFINLEGEMLKEQFSEAMRELSMLEKKGDKNKTQSLLEKCQNISQKINELGLKKVKNIF